MNTRLVQLLLSLSLGLLAFAGNAKAFDLQLQNGWTTAVFGNGKPEAFVSDGIVHLKGAIQSGTSSVAFTLPPSMRPATHVYTHVDLCNAAQGRLMIQPSGVVSVSEAGGGFGTMAQCFTSLDGVKFATSLAGSTPLALQNGWSNAPFGAANASARLIDGIVHLSGAVHGGTTGTLFTLPVEMRPATDVYVRVDLCDAHTGRLYIQPSGAVSVHALTDFARAQCFTSLEGASFAPAAAGFADQSLLNGWTNAPFGTSNAAASLGSDGIVRFKGAIGGGSTDHLFTLPTNLRSTHHAWIPIDLCSTKPGRLHVYPNGAVRVELANGIIFADAQCFTSLDGASFIPTREGFQPLSLLNGWFTNPFDTQTASVALYDGIVHFKGALTFGTTPVLFRLPVTVRPETSVYVAVDLCNAVTGRILIQSDGYVMVQTTTTFDDPECFTSLEGASYALTATGFTPLALQNGWTGSPFGTSAPTAAIVDGVVQLKGALSGGTANPAFTLPVSMRPAAPVYLPIGLVNAKKGRLMIDSQGQGWLYGLATFADAQGFSSLDGLKFAPASNTAFAPLSPTNGWTPSVFTEAPGATLVRDIVYLKGSISNGATINSAFTLPPVLRPEADVYVPVDTCNGNKGRLWIQPSGSVRVMELGGGETNANCFTSLDNASYAVPEASFAPALASGLLLLAGIRRRSARRAESAAKEVATPEAA